MIPWYIVPVDGTTVSIVAALTIAGFSLSWGWSGRYLRQRQAPKVDRAESVHVSGQTDVSFYVSVPKPQPVQAQLRTIQRVQNEDCAEAIHRLDREMDQADVEISRVATHVKAHGIGPGLQDRLDLLIHRRDDLAQERNRLTHQAGGPSIPRPNNDRCRCRSCVAARAAKLRDRSQGSTKVVAWGGQLVRTIDGGDRLDGVESWAN